MKKVKVSIQDENTLLLLEDAQKGDIIDLKSIHETDIDKTSINGLIKSIKDEEFNKQIETAKQSIEENTKLEAKLNEKNIIERAKEALSKKDVEIAELKSKIDKADVEKKLSVTEAVRKVEKERDDLAGELKSKETEKQLLQKSLQEKHAAELKTKDDIIKMKDEEITLRKDLKLKLSTKMVGETLEQHCEIEFNKLRATAFQRAYFEKDNDSTSGSKGDYIYRENDESGNEIISIMFDMKNEGDDTTNKKRNEDFLKELDKDRTEKKCEYAVLVSLLEAENELYNTGIVDVSYKFPKMYVVRPQFFIPIITLLRNAAMNSLKYKSELALVRSQNIDITNFENELQLFQDGFMKNVKDSSSKFQEAMDGIDATIKKLEGIKDALRLSNKHLLTAGNKVETVSIKRLTKDNPTMAAKFAELSDGK